MSLLEAVFMGIIQGLTEFLPVSSSGHLAIFKNIFHINTDTGILFDILLHLGTLVAVCVIYYKELFNMIKEGFGIIGDSCYNIKIFFQNIKKEEKICYRRVVKNSYRKFVMLVIVSTFPTAIIGYLAQDLVEAVSEILFIPGICLIITSILLFISDRVKDGTKKPRQVTYTNAFAIGICQGIATLPGISRSGTTITACLITGLNRSFAVKYSFIMSIPAILGAAVLQLKDIGSIQVSSTEVTYYIVGMVISAIIGYICMKTLLIIVRKKKFIFFSIYCFVMGVFSIGAYFFLL